jgi:hypothetical protein
MRSWLPPASALAQLVLLLVAFPASGLARVRPGVEAGVNLSSLGYDDLPSFYDDLWNPRWKTSFTGGASVEFPLQGRLALTTGLRYVQQGNRVKYDTGPGLVQRVGEFRVVQNYLAMPMLLEGRPLPSRRFVFSFGPEIALLLSGRQIVEETVFTAGVPQTRSEDNNIKNDLKSTNVSLDAGIGFEFPMENHVGLVSLRYSRGLTGVAKKDAWVSDWKTREVDASVGMRW